MSRHLSLREALVRPVDGQAGSREKSGSRVRLLIRAGSEVARPIDLARCLVEHGLSLRAAHAALEKLAAGDTLAIEARDADREPLISRLEALGVSSLEIRVPDVNVRKVRRHLGLSQAEFATRFGFERDTIQNWEQGRHKPDASARVLLAIIDRRPGLVEAALTGWSHAEEAGPRLPEEGRA